MMINKDKRMIVVNNVVGDVVIKHMGCGGGGICQPHRANNGICISWTSTTEKKGSFVQCTLRMLLHMTCILDIVSILHVIILGKYS